MPMPATLTRLYRRFDPDWRMERAAAAHLDANLARLIATDPDAARIFEPGEFSRALEDLYGFGVQHDERVQAYAAAKHAQDRMDLYGQLFAGLDA